MAIAFRAASSGDPATTGNFTMTKPAGTASTDVLVISVSFGATGNTVTAPAGWTAVATAVGNTTFRASCWWALGSVTNLTFTVAGTNWPGWACAGFSGVDNTTPVDATGTTSTSTAAATVTANAVTTVTANAYHLIAGGCWNSGAMSATGFTVSENGGLTAQQAASVLHKALGAAGSTGTVSCSNNGPTAGQILVAIPFALRPAAAGGGGGPFPWFLDDALAGGLHVMGI